MNSGARGLMGHLVVAATLGLAVPGPSVAAASCDVDGDGYLNATRKCGCNDCNDADGELNPGAVEVCGNGVDDNCSGTADENCSASLPKRISVAGDSITRGFVADCGCNTNFLCLPCLLGGDQPEHSRLDGGRHRSPSSGRRSR